MARIRIRLDLEELKRVMKALSALGLSIYGQVYNRKTNEYHEALMDYDYKDIKALAITLSKGIEPEMYQRYELPAPKRGRPKGSKNKKKRKAKKR